MKNKLIKKVLLWIGGIIGFIIFLGIILPSTPELEPVINNNVVIPEKSNDVVDPIVTHIEEPVAVKSAEINKITPPVVSDSSQYKYYSVTSVVDGDTIKISIDGTVTTLRLIGLDTPETVDPRKPVQCFGKEASNKAKELLSGKKIRIEKDSTQGDLDKYGRTLAYVFREDGLFYNKYMIEQGYAHEYTYGTPYKYQTEFKNAQKTAQTNLLGLWSPNTCNGDTTSETIAETTTSTGKFYTSSYSTSKYYYPDSCDGWKSLTEKYLKSFNTLEDLLKTYPTRTKSPQCE